MHARRLPMGRDGGLTNFYFQNLFTSTEATRYNAEDAMVRRRHAGLTLLPILDNPRSVSSHGAFVLAWPKASDLIPAAMFLLRHARDCTESRPIMAHHGVRHHTDPASASGGDTRL